MGSCLRKHHSLTQVHAVRITQVKCDYDMSQVRSTYMLGVHNDTNVSVSMKTLDLAYVASNFILRSIRSTLHSVCVSSRGLICGLGTESIIDGQKSSSFYLAKSAKVLHETVLTLRKGESLRKLEVSYTDTAITGLQLLTELQKVKAGNIDNSEYHSEADYFEVESAILGFDVTFGADRLVELALIVAPIHRNATESAALTKPYLNGSSFALVDENFYQMMKKQSEDVIVKHVFKETKELRKLKSL